MKRARNPDTRDSWRDSIYTFGMPEISSYKLTKWRRYLLLRDVIVIAEIQTHDGKPKLLRSSWCPMCNTAHQSWRMQAHHIRPKSEYPELALELSNGIMLCLRCHMALTHTGNSFKDMKEIGHWKFFRPAFDRYVNLATQRRYNEENQHKI